VEIKKPKKGSVLVWEKAQFEDDGLHGHIGFYIGNKKAISNDYKTGCPAEHNYQFRKIESIWWHSKID